MSSGGITCRSITARLKFGAYSFRMSKQRSAKRSFSTVPVVPVKWYGSVLDEHGHDVLARRGQGVVEGRGHRAFEDRVRGRPAVLGVVVGPFDVVHARADVHGAAVLRADAGARQDT